MKVLVVGDVMIDQYTYVTTNRRASEANIPVWDELNVENRLGGAANVAHNLKSLGGDEIEVYLAGIVDSTKKTRSLFKQNEIDTFLCSGGDTMVKHRYVDVSRSMYLLRSDSMTRFPDHRISHFTDLFVKMSEDMRFDAVVFSDYDKGTISERIIDAASHLTDGFRVVDSKREDVSIFSGCDVLKLNEVEYSWQCSSKLYPAVESMFKYCVVTRGAAGSELKTAKSITDTCKVKYRVDTEAFSVDKVNTCDVTGCGDTHTAAMTFSLLKNNDIRMAVKFANACARSVVQKFGTSVSNVRDVQTVV